MKSIIDVSTKTNPRQIKTQDASIVINEKDYNDIACFILNNAFFLLKDFIENQYEALNYLSEQYQSIYNNLLTFRDNIKENNHEFSVDNFSQNHFVLSFVKHFNDTFYDNTPSYNDKPLKLSTLKTIEKAIKGIESSASGFIDEEKVDPLFSKENIRVISNYHHSNKTYITVIISESTEFTTSLSFGDICQFLSEALDWNEVFSNNLHDALESTFECYQIIHYFNKQMRISRKSIWHNNEKIIFDLNNPEKTEIFEMDETENEETYKFLVNLTNNFGNCSDFYKNVVQATY